jgi:hypothetical protein
LGIFVLAAMKSESLDEGTPYTHSESQLITGLEQYRTQTPYIDYYFGPRNDLPPPGVYSRLSSMYRLFHLQSQCSITAQN